MKSTRYYKIKRLLGREVTPPPGKVWLGDLERSRPFCRSYGLSRGTAVDRVFIERFLQSESACIRGRVLEVRNNDYTREFGGDAVTGSDIVDIDPENRLATIVDDLRTMTTVEDACFDCIILTQTLHLIDDDGAVMKNLFRILKAGGTLLMTVPCISLVPRREDQGTWYRFYTDHGLHYLLGTCFQPAKIEVVPYGNLVAATAFLHGLAASELKPKWFEHEDPAYPVIIGARATKGG